MALSTWQGDVKVTGDFQANTMTLPAASVTNDTLASNAAVVRSKLAQESLAVYPINLVDFRVWNAFQTNLPSPSALDDIGLYGGTFATDSPSLQSYDVKTVGATTLYARCMFSLPAEYVDGETVTIRLSGGMITAVADTTATLDVEVFKSDREAGIGADICATAAQSNNALVFADLDFEITPAGLAAGDIFDMRLTMAVNDGAGGAAVISAIGAVELLCDIKG